MVFTNAFKVRIAICIIDFFRSKNIDIVLRGERKKGIWQIDVSVFEEAEQLSFFDK